MLDLDVDVDVDEDLDLESEIGGIGSVFCIRQRQRRSRRIHKMMDDDILIAPRSSHQAHHAPFSCIISLCRDQDDALTSHNRQAFFTSETTRTRLCGSAELLN